MEVFAQLWDEIDDWLGCIRQAWLSLRFDLPTDVDFSSTSILR